MRKKAWVIFLAALVFGFCLPVFGEEEAAMKKAVMVIAQENFRDEELIEPIDILEKNDVEVTVAAQSLDEARGMLGAKVRPDITINDVKAADFDAIVFVGGSGSDVYWDDPVAQRIAQDAVIGNKVIAAICIAPVTLARAGILKGKKATVFPDCAADLTQAGATFTGKPVERDGKTVTASGPEATSQFGWEIVKAMK
jgi:protease I